MDNTKIKFEKRENKIKKVISCGAFVLENEKILLVQHKNGEHWSFPKGHMEPSETMQQTAMREVREETGIEIQIVSDRTYKTMYVIPPDIQKTVFYYEAIKVKGNLKKQESEIIDIGWFSYNEALEYLTFSEDKKVLETFLKEKN